MPPWTDGRHFFGLALLALMSVGCTGLREKLTEPPISVDPLPVSFDLTSEPPIVGDPLPGSFYLISEPPLAPFRVVIRSDDEGGPSGRNERFEPGDEVTLHWSDLPLPSRKWIEVNGQDCEGTFGIEARIETDLVLALAGGACRIEVVGSHPEGTVHIWPDD